MPVNLLGEDSGVGIRHYDVYVSKDDGELALWLDNTTEKNADFAGEFGHSYSFYSVAVDHARNSEPFLDLPDATVQFISPWLNIMNAVDVNGDGFVSPIDALLQINVINFQGSAPLPDERGEIAPPFLDVSGMVG